MDASPLGRTVAHDAWGTLRSRREAWLLVLLNAIAVVVVAADATQLEGPPADPVAGFAIWFLIGLFAIAEAATVRVDVHGLPLPITLRATPFLVGVFFLAPIEVVATAVLGTTIGVLVRRVALVPAVVSVASGAAGVAVGALCFRAISSIAGDTPRGWWLAAYVAAVAMTGICIIGQLSGRPASGPRASRQAMGFLLLYGAVVGVAEASIGIIVVIFLATDPSEVWLLTGPTVAAIVAYRGYAALQRAGEAKSRFLANVSHELRTPLHSILLAARLLEDPSIARSDRRRRRTLPATIEGSGRYLLQLVDDLVDLSRIDIHDLRVAPTVIDIGVLLEETRRVIQPLAAEKEIGLAFENSVTHRVLADPIRLRQVLLNLISNAIKFTPSGGDVAVSSATEGADLVIRVRDTGIGIDAGELPRIFEPFERLGRDSEAGTGLGLAIAQRIVELHHGTLTASSIPGIGSTFVICLPQPTTLAADGGDSPRRRRDAPGGGRPGAGSDAQVGSGAGSTP